MPDLTPKSSSLSNISFDGISTPIKIGSTEFDTWMTQAQMAEYFSLSVPTVNEHIKSFLASGGEADSVIRKFRITAADGKAYVVAHYGADIFVYIGYRAQATNKVIAFRKGIAQLFRERVEEHSDPELGVLRAKERARGRYLEKGNKDEWIDQRLSAIDTVKRYCDLIAGKNSDPNYAQIFDTEYLVLLQHRAWELRKMLNTNKVRDRLPAHTLAAIALLETSISALLEQEEAVAQEQIIRLIREVAKPIAETLDKISDIINADKITGAPMLKAKW